MGQALVKYHDGYHYYVVFIDDECIRFTWFYPLKQKLEFFSVNLKFGTSIQQKQLKNFGLMVEGSF